MAEVRNVRRWYLHQRIEARLYEDSDLDTVWQSKQEAIAGTALAADFPHKATLEPIGYTTHEDLDGADETELVRAGLTTSQAKAVISAL